MNYRKFRKNLKAISPIISVLLMIAIAVVASLVVYAWVMGYIGYQTSKTGDAVQIQSVAFTQGATDSLSKVYLQNVGTTTVTIIQPQCLYVNGTLDASAQVSVLGLPAGNTTIITASGQPFETFAPGTTVTIKVTTAGGTYSQITQQAP